MKRFIIITLLTCLYTNITADDASIKQQTDSLMAAAERFQLMLSNTPCGENRAYIADELRDKELVIGFKTRQTVDETCNIYHVYMPFTDANGQKSDCSAIAFIASLRFAVSKGMQLMMFRAIHEKSYNIFILLPDDQQPIESVITPLSFYTLCKNIYKRPFELAMPLGKLVFNPSDPEATTLDLNAHGNYTIKEIAETDASETGGYVLVVQELTCQSPFGIAITEPETGKVLLLGAVNSVPAK